jgi:S1-C subfamily serine protease
VGIGIILAFILALIFYKFFYPQLKHDTMLNNLNLQDAHNSRVETLKGEIDRYRQALQGDVCALPSLNDLRPLLSSRRGQSQNQTPPSNGGQTQGGGGQTQGGGGQTPADGKEPPGRDEALRQFDEPLNPEAGDLVVQSTVLVVVNGRDSGSIGTGFFINDKQILTNRHVIDLAIGQDDAVFVTNKILGTLVPARIVAYSSSNEGFRDYAVIQIDDASSPNYLKIATNVKQRERVGAYGYPGLNMEMDPQMQALYAGDKDSVPEVVYTEGVISVIQNVDGIPIITHTAEVSHGNSGGPLVDGNGNAIAINTAIYTDLMRQQDDKKASTRQLNLSLGASDFVKFLNSNNIKFEESSAT